MSDPNSGELEVLLADAVSVKGSNSTCWAMRFRASVEPLGLAFLEAIEANPDKYVPQRVSMLLQSRFGFTIGRCGVDKHLKGSCSCKTGKTTRTGNPSNPSNPTRSSSP